MTMVMIIMMMSMRASEERRVNGTANKVNGDVNGFVRGGSGVDRRRTDLDELPMRSVQPPDVVSSQRRRDINVTGRGAASSADDDSLEVGGLSLIHI